MKKKGLIVATIVMVLVLAVSLTTATYAWFTVTDVTTIDAFEISVVAGNAVNVGVKTNNTYKATVTANDFMNGTVVYTPATGGGNIGGGTWSGGSTGLGATIDHDIAWGAQSAAVGITSAALQQATIEVDDDNDPDTPTITEDVEGYWTGATNGNTTAWTNSGIVIAANAAATTDESAALTNVTKAFANKNGVRYSAGADDTKVGDYAYLYIGASPTKALDSNELVILIDGSATSGQIVGILSAIHVAYRVNGGEGASGDTAGNWKDLDVFSIDNEATTETEEEFHYSDNITSVGCNLTETQRNAYKESYGNEAPTTGAWAVTIPLTALTQGAIDQIEIVIYIAGADSDCRDEAKGASGEISIFFNAIEKEVQNNG